MKNIIEIIIKPKHFRLATKFIDGISCPLTLAIQDHFQNINYFCYGCEHVRFKWHLVYSIEDCWYNKTPGLRNGTNETVDSLIKKAKQKKKVGNYIVKLIRY